MYVCMYVLTQYFVPCVHVRFYFPLPLIFTLLAAPSWPLAFLIVSPPVWIFMFFFLQNSSLLFSITRSSSFSVIHVSINIKYNVEKDTTLLVFLSFLKSRRPCDFVAFRLPWLNYFTLVYLWCGRTFGRSIGRSVYSHVITKFSRMGSFYTTFSYLWCSAIILYILRTFSSSELVEPHINDFKVRLASSVERRR